jgi:NAD(P)H-hydrate repair Nnr-like enzyme with NAD(P)H-hydrate epimerase domain
MNEAKTMVQPEPSKNDCRMIADQLANQAATIRHLAKRDKHSRTESEQIRWEALGVAFTEVAEIVSTQWNPDRDFVAHDSLAVSDGIVGTGLNAEHKDDRFPA